MGRMKRGGDDELDGLESGGEEVEEKGAKVGAGPHGSDGVGYLDLAHIATVHVGRRWLFRPAWAEGSRGSGFRSGGRGPSASAGPRRSQRDHHRCPRNQTCVVRRPHHARASHSARGACTVRPTRAPAAHCLPFASDHARLASSVASRSPPSPHSCPERCGAGERRGPG